MILFCTMLLYKNGGMLERKIIKKGETWTQKTP